MWSSSAPFFPLILVEQVVFRAHVVHQSDPQTSSLWAKGGPDWKANGLAVSPPSSHPGLWCRRLGQETTYRNILETHANEKVARPVGKTSHGHGCWAGTLAEELGHDEPGNGTRADLKECHKAEDGHDGDIAHGWKPLLGARQGGWEFRSDLSGSSFALNPDN